MNVSSITLTVTIYITLLLCRPNVVKVDGKSLALFFLELVMIPCLADWMIMNLLPFNYQVYVIAGTVELCGLPCVGVKIDDYYNYLQL